MRPAQLGLLTRRSIGPGPARTKFYTRRVVGAGPWGFTTHLAFSRDGTVRATGADGLIGCVYWDAVLDQWVPYLTATNLIAAGVDPSLAGSGGVRAIAVAPSQPLRVYFVWNNAIWRSDTGLRTPVVGQAFTKIRDNVTCAANDSTRAWAGALWIDPNNPDFMIYGSQLNGLLVTRDGGRTWDDQPTVTPGGATLPPGVTVPVDAATDQDRTTAVVGGVAIATAGISSVIANPANSSEIWVQIYGVGVFHSIDAARTFAALPVPTDSGGVQYPTLRDLTLQPDGSLLAVAMASNTNFKLADVWRYTTAGGWVMVLHAAGYGYRAIAVDPNNPTRVVVMASGGGASGNRMAISVNSGAAGTWSTPASKTVDGTGDVVGAATVISTTGSFTVSQILFDPVVRNRLWMADGIAIWYVDLPDYPTIPTTIAWKAQARGITQLVINRVCYAAAKMLLAVWDRRLVGVPRLSKTYDALPGNGIGTDFGSGWDIASSPDGNYIAVPIASHQDALANPPVEDSSPSGRSKDGGTSFASWPSVPTWTNAWTDAKGNVRTHKFAFGSMAVTAFTDGTGYTTVWCPAYGNRPGYSSDDGTSWQQLALPGGFTTADYQKINNLTHNTSRFQVCADQVTPDLVYLLVSGTDALKAGIFTITSKGTSTSRVGAVPADSSSTAYAGALQLSATPGNAGHLWLCGATDTFRRSVNGGAGWTDVTTITAVTCFGFGAAMPGSSGYPAMYAAGTVGGVTGLYRSADAATTWTLLKRYPGDKPSPIVALDADKTVPGRVLIGATPGASYGEDSTVTDNAAA